MKVKKLSPFHLLAVLLIVAYLFLIWGNLRSSLLNTSSVFGYLDFQNNWRALEDFINFRVPFRDYFFEYGSFFLFLQAPAYLLFGRGFLAVLVSRYLFLPLVGLFLSCVIAANVLRKKHLILISLFFLLLFGANYDYTSVRHLMAELSLSFFVLFFLQRKSRHLFVSGVIAGLAVLTALEYGLALNIALLLAFLFSLFSRTDLKKYFFNRFIFGELIILAPYFLILYLKGALKTFFDFTLGYINVFYSASPCSSGSFPRWKEIQILSQTSKLLVFNISIEFLQKVNFYIVFGFFTLVVLTLVTILVRKRMVVADHLIWFSLAIYGLLIFVRTLDTPCLGYFVYGLTPFFLLLVLFIEKIISWSRQRQPFVGVLGVIIIFSWFTLTENTGYLVKVFGKKEAPIKKEVLEKEFYSPAGWFINKDLANGYKEVVGYITSNTEKHDYLYVYPWGPYNDLTGRKSPNSITNAFHFVIGQKFIERTRQELEAKQPKLVVINIYNNLGVAHYGKTRGDVSRYFSLGYEDGPVFNGEGNEVEKYILENYETVFHNNLAIVMKPRLSPLIIKENKKVVYLAENWQKENVKLERMTKKDKNGEYAIKGKNAGWTFTFDRPLEAEDIAVEFKIDGNLLTKHFTRYFLNFYVSLADEKKLWLFKDLATKEWQTKKIPFVKPERITAIKLEISENSGLIWWLNPNRLEVKKVEVYGE